jgi:protein O-mannosyl-transferase
MSRRSQKARPKAPPVQVETSSPGTQAKQGEPRRGNEPSAASTEPIAGRSSPTGIGGGATLKWGLAIALAVVTLVVYAPTWWYGVLSIDDPVYVVDNIHVASGVTPSNVAWGFTSFHDSNWIPLTWLSLMLDVSLYSGHLGGFHLTNTLLHAASTVLLFLLLARATGYELRSAFVAGLFALHPLHVESVAWIAERKDVLSIFFGMLSLGAYVRYGVGARRINLLLAFVFLAASLMAKQTLVTLPFVFLLLDFWPLGRMAGVLRSGSRPAERLSADARRLIPRLLLEKLPFFGLSAAFSAVAAIAQSHGGAVVEALPFSIRLMNAVVVYAIYLLKTVVPIDLAVYYPHPGYRLVWTAVAAPAVLLLVVSAIAVIQIRLPYLFVGWCWYLGTFVPMIGLVQIGGQQMADRYTYFPLIGIFLAATWLVAEMVPAGMLRDRVLPAAAVGVLGLFAAVSFHQIGYWHDSISLLVHDVAVLPDEPTPHEYLGKAYLYAELPEKAIPELEAAIRLAPPDATLEYKLAGALEKVGRADEATRHYEAALKLDDKSAMTHNDFAVLLMSRHRDAAAQRQLERAIELDPNLANAQANLSLLCAKSGDYAGAIAHGERALALDPKQIDCYHYIAVALRGQGRYDEAIQKLEQLLRIDPSYQVARKEIEITKAMQLRQHSR